MRLDDSSLELPAEAGARLVVLGLLDDAAEAVAALAGGAGAEPLHDFRVAVRRLRTALRALRPWLRGVREHDERRLRKLARATNEARDAEVQLAWLAARRDPLASGARRPGWELAVARCEARLRGGPDPARVAARFRKAARKLRKHARRAGRERRGGERLFAPALASLVRERAAALATRIAAIRDAADEARVHRARIAGKRLRYLLEPLRGVAGADATGAVGRLKRLQDVLGALHDAHVLAADLGEALADAAAERARRVHAAVSAGPAGGDAVREALRASPRPGLLALSRAVRAERDARFAELDRERRGGGLAALASELSRLAAALEGRGGVPSPGAERAPAPPRRAAVLRARRARRARR